MQKYTGLLFYSVLCLFNLFSNIPLHAQNTDTLFYDSFDDMSSWTPVGPQGFDNWSIENSNNAGGNSSPEVRFTWEYLFVGESYLLASSVFSGIEGHNMELKFNYLEDYWSNIVYVGVAITGDAGTTYTSIWELQASGNSGPEEITVDFTGIQNMQVALYYSGDANDIDFWYVDDITLIDLDAVPVELTSFTAAAVNGDVVLNWKTATEKNNKGFEIERSGYPGAGTRTWKRIGFVNGNGTTIRPSDYSFLDNDVEPSDYSYRLKQIDFNGSFEYSNIAEAKVIAPAVFALEQNYPNPFNPSTRINFSLAVESRVTLDVFNIIGQKVKTLINRNLPAGQNSLTFDASHLNSGIYFYRIDAEGTNGYKFSSVKKMMVTK
jgi:hypothetical protein